MAVIMGKVTQLLFFFLIGANSDYVQQFKTPIFRLLTSEALTHWLVPAGEKASSKTGICKQDICIWLIMIRRRASPSRVTLCRNPCIFFQGRRHKRTCTLMGHESVTQHSRWKMCCSDAPHTTDSTSETRGSNSHWAIGFYTLPLVLLSWLKWMVRSCLTKQRGGYISQNGGKNR